MRTINTRKVDNLGEMPKKENNAYYQKPGKIWPFNLDFCIKWLLVIILQLLLNESIEDWLLLAPISSTLFISAFGR